MEIQEIIKGYDLKKDIDCWVHKQSGKLCLKHTAHQKIASIEGYKLKELKPINSTESLVRFIVIVSKLEKKDDQLIVVDETMSIGEADTKNSFNAYLGCMAEKRGFDRCVRNLLGINDVAFSEEDYTDAKNQTYASNENWELSSGQRDWAHREIKQLQKAENERNDLKGEEPVDVFERETKKLEGLNDNDEFSKFVFGIKGKCKQLKEEIGNYENK